MNCKNCKKKIKDLNTACYSREVNEPFCSLECLTNFAYEYLSCIPIEKAQLNGEKE